MVANRVRSSKKVRRLRVVEYDLRPRSARMEDSVEADIVYDTG